MNAVQFDVAAVKQALLKPVARPSANTEQGGARNRATLYSPNELQVEEGYIPEDNGPAQVIVPGEAPPPPTETSNGQLAPPDAGPQFEPSEDTPPSEIELTLVRGADGRLYGVQQEKTDEQPEQKESIIEQTNRAVRNARKIKQQAKGNTLTRAQEAQISKLKQRDMEVRMHEMAHAAAAGPYAVGGVNFSYQIGPDGRQYAVGGNVNVDTSPADTPEETVLKMQVIRRASVSPSGPSMQDIQVAAKASMTELRARSEIADKYFSILGSEPPVEQEGLEAPRKHKERRSPLNKAQDVNKEVRQSRYEKALRRMYGLDETEGEPQVKRKA